MFSDGFDDTPIKRGGGGSGTNFQSSGSSGNGSFYPCSICNRTFAADRIQQHEAVCMKSNKQRRVFDSTKQRLQGTEAASYFRKGKSVRNAPAKPQV